MKTHIQPKNSQLNHDKQITHNSQAFIIIKTLFWSSHSFLFILYGLNLSMWFQLLDLLVESYFGLFCQLISQIKLNFFWISETEPCSNLFPFLFFFLKFQLALLILEKFFSSRFSIQYNCHGWTIVDGGLGKIFRNFDQMNVTV